MSSVVDVLKNLLFRYRLRKTLKAIVVGNGNVFMRGFGLIGNLKSSEQCIVGSQCVLTHQAIFERYGHGKIIIGDRCHIGGNTNLVSINGIHIGSDVTIAWDCLIYDHDSHSLEWNDRCNDTLQEIRDYQETGNPIANKDWSKVKSAPIKIGDKAWLGMGVTVLKGVTIGEGAVIGARSVVTRDVPPYCVVAGNPARVIRDLSVKGVK